MILDGEDHFYARKFCCMTNDPSQHLFIVRMWQEVGSRKLDRWPGPFEQRPLAQRLYFPSPDDLSNIIMLTLNNKVEEDRV